MSEEQTVPLSQVEERVKEIFGSDNRVKTNLVSLLVGNKPIGYRGKSIAPYYKERYGRAMKSVFDSMVAAANAGQPSSKIFYYADYCKGGCKKRTTLYSKIYYGIRYLTECMDDAQRTYGRLYNCIDIRRDDKLQGVVIEFNVGYDGGELPEETDFIPVAVIPTKDIPKWRASLDKWLEESPVGGKPFYSAGLLIPAAELAELKLDLAPLKNILSVVTAKEIKLIKINPENI